MNWWVEKGNRLGGVSPPDSKVIKKYKSFTKFSHKKTDKNGKKTALFGLKVKKCDF